MPSINDIATIAESMGKCPIAVEKDRCVAVRNRNASCRECVHACPADAITVAANDISISTSACIGCGACAVVCPTEALVALDPLDTDLALAAARSFAANDGEVVFACARISSKRLADPTRYAEVPCLARLEESLFIALVAHGATDVLLVDGTCATCKHRACVPGIDAAVAQANSLLSDHGSPVRVRRVNAFPEKLVSDDARELHGSSRRGFFSDAAQAAKDAAMSAAQATIAQELGMKKKEVPIGERLRVDDTGALPKMRVSRLEQTIDALDLLGGPCVDVVVSRLFGAVDIDVSRCNACGMCAVFCPTGALRRDPVEKANDPVRFLEFSASDCAQCGLCVDVCWKRCITLTDEVPADQLFDFEPRTFTMPPQHKDAWGVFTHGRS